MSDKLVLHELPPSPNNQKVRVGLGFKGLEFERKILQFDEFPGDRSAIVEASGQPRTPALVHGDRAIFDSGAILRYLEANFRDTPSLFSTDYAEMGTIEQWEWMARTQLGDPVRMIFGQAFAPEKDAAVIAGACRMMNEITGQIEDQVSTGGYLVAGRMTVADVAAAPLVNLAMLDAEKTDGPVTGFFAQNFKLGDGRDLTRDWVQRVLSHDPYR